MTDRKEPVIGILGGMGPEATSSLFSLIIANTAAHTDQEHVPVMIWNNPKIPDRSAFILGQGPSPVPLLIEGSRMLAAMGTSCILWPCNTAHHFIGEVQPHVEVPILNMIRETAVMAHKDFPQGTRFGLLSTLGTYHTHLYTDHFSNEAIGLILPSGKNRERTMQSIYGKQGIKAGYRKEPLEMLQEPLRDLKKAGVEVVIAGCTELSLVLNPATAGLPVLYPMEVLARAALRFVGYPVKG